MEARVQPGAAMTNKFELQIDTMPPIYFVRIGEMTQEVVLAEMADGTMQTTGKLKPGETEVEHYPHHPTERVAMEAWRIACLSGTEGHKRNGILYFNGADGNPVFAWLIRGMILKSRKSPELNAQSDGEGIKMTYMVSFDDTVGL